jgi:predicted metalloprotease with PDZ domain
LDNTARVPKLSALFFVFCCLAGVRSGAHAATQLRLSLDASDAPRQVWHAQLQVPVAGGDVVLVYPKWIPGNHGPTGPIANLGSLQPTCGATRVAWTRDALDPYAFHFAVPAGCARLDLAYDLFEGSPANGNMTAQLGVLDWNQVVLYPQGASIHDVVVAADITLPAGWSAATALPPAAARAPFEPLTGHAAFAPVTLETLVDSPLYTGAHERVVPLVDAGGMTSEVDLFGETAADVEPTSQQVARWQALVAQADALYGYRHWQHYHFLLTLSDAESGRGLEHHQSSANGLPGRYLSDPDIYESGSDLLPHEYTHSWNGKYRRPFGLMTNNYQEPMVDDDLWVYEGMTQYWGVVLAQRSGLAEPGTFEETLANYYASLDVEPGRLTRPLLDTARAQGLTRAAQSPSGRFARRGEDYYIEGALIWLDADTLIRERTHGRRSLDDFARRFLGNGHATPPMVLGYSRADVIAALNAVLPYDWSAFLHQRVDEVAVHPPAGGLQRGGWHFTYSAERSDFQLRRERASRGIDATYSLGAFITVDGTVAYTIDTFPLGRAGVAAGSKILAVNDQEFSPDRLRLALRSARTSTAPIRFIVDDLGVLQTFAVDYHGGERYPHLVRDPERPDLLSAIAAPRITMGAR